MTAIDRTAYPRPGTRLTREELTARYDLAASELAFLRANTRGDWGRLVLATLLKTRQDLGYFAMPEKVHPDTVAHLASQLGLTAPPLWPDKSRRKKAFDRYQSAVRAHLSVRAYDESAQSMVSNATRKAAETMSDPADLINRAIEELQSAAIDLPAFSTLDRLVNSVRAEVHAQIYGRVRQRLTAEHKLIDPEPLLEGIAHTKLRQFASEAAALEVQDLLDLARPGKRYTLLLSLLRQSRLRCRDELIEMMLRRIRRTQAAAKEKLEALHDQHREIEEALIGIFGQVLETEQAQETDAAFGRQVRQLLAERGGVEALAEQCETASAWHNKNDLPLLWPIHAKHRSLLFQLLDLLDIRSATQEASRLDALSLVRRLRHARRDEVLEEVDLGFAAERWQRFVVKPRSEPVAVNRRALEVCVFVHWAAALQAGDVYGAGAENFADSRVQLLPWTECEPRLGAYCAALGMPERGQDFVAALKRELIAAAAEVDAGFEANAALSLDPDGTPRLKQLATTARPEGLAEFEQEVRARMPERHLLDILKNAEHWAQFTRHFGPPSGSDPKLAQAIQRYLFTVFGYGCNLGPNQTARHAPEIATAQALRRINAQHINADKLESAMVDVIGQYVRFPLPRHWGSGRAAIADGTHVKLRENNLFGSRHIRYGGYGGIAYHHIADTYIALFTSFITCGVWEAVHILDALLKNRSEIQPDTLHADTQGQSEPVFGLCRRLGIKLMPRMRGLSDAVFYRPSKAIRYQHIDTLFGDEIDWDLIATHARDMVQVALSIQAGRVMPSMLLRKLGAYSRRSLLYRAFRELGRVERTLFLLRFVSSTEVRRTIRAETTKTEAFNDFLDWVSFGGPVVTSGDPVEQEKQLKDASLANTIMLSNVADMTGVLASMAEDKHPVTPGLVACLSPYTREHIRRFGQYVLDMSDLPGPLEPRPLPFEPTL